MNVSLLARLAAAVVALWVPAAWGFDFERYQATKERTGR
jgi:hypothetical protein